LPILYKNSVDFKVVLVYNKINTKNVCKNGGKMNTEIKNAITAADAKIQYDTYAKRLLAQKSILANILVKTVAEFKDMKLLC